MTDSSFDKLEAFLKKKNSKVIERVGGAESQLLKYKHMDAMLSLDKQQVNDENSMPKEVIANLSEWAISKYPLEASPKFDGNACELNYDFGSLQQALTRGKNGLGADITRFMKLLTPSSIDCLDRLEIRGEIVMPLDRYPKYNSTKNIRNFVAGVVSPGRSDTSPALADCIFVAYSVKKHNKDGTITYVPNALAYLESLGFNKQYPVKTMRINSAADFARVYDVFKAYRPESPIQLDGIVLKAPEEMRVRIGANNRHPKWAIAIKFPSLEVSTTIVEYGDYCFDWSVGRTGELAPTSILAAVDLDGSEVKRASVYNKNKIEQMGCFPGAVVIIKKSGDIIPAIVRVVKRSPRENEYMTKQNFYPRNCPSCGTVLTITTDYEKDGGETTHIVCKNHTGCVAQVARNLDYAVTALGLKGIGPSTCESLAHAGVRNVFDLFDITLMNEPRLIASGRFKKGRDLEKILSAVKSLKKVELKNLIQTLGFRHLGKSVSAEVAKMYAGVPYTFSSLNSDVVEPFLDKNSVQYKAGVRIQELFTSLGIEIVMPGAPVKLPDGTIMFEMTGSTSNAGYKTKGDLVEFLKLKGYAHTDISNANLLLTDDLSSSTSKMKAAAKKGIKIMSYEQLLNSL